MPQLWVDQAEVQAVKKAVDQDPLNVGIGVLHEPTGTIHLKPFDDVPGGHAELAMMHNWPLNECKGFVVSKAPSGTYVPVNNSHLNGTQGVPGSLQMPQVTFTEIVNALQAAGL